MAYIFMLIGLLFVATEAAANEPRACIPFEKGSQKEKKLVAGDPGVIHDTIAFTYISDQYSIDVYSSKHDGTQAPQRYCLRYEIENSGKKDVAMVYWEDAKLLVKKLSSGPDYRRSKVYDYPLLYPPMERHTKIYAFTDIQKSVRAWKIADDDPLKKHFFDKEKIDAGLMTDPTWAPTTAKLISAEKLGTSLQIVSEKFKLPRDPVWTLKLPSDASYKAPYFHEHYAGEDFSLSIYSSASVERGKIEFTTSISADGAGASKYQYRMPALDSFPFAAVKNRSADFDGYVSAFNIFSKRDRKFEGKWFFRNSVSIADLPYGGIFAINHPVYIKSDASYECFFITSYSPVPVNFGREQCAE